MKTDKVLGILVIIVFILLGGAYAQFVVQEQATAKNIRGLNRKVGDFDAILKKIGSQAKDNADIIKNIEDKATANDARSRDVASKLEEMDKDIQQLQNDVKEAIALKEVKVSAAPAVTPVAGSVQLAPAGGSTVSTEAQTAPADTVMPAAERSTVEGQALQP
ncbi:MAG: hypothetical protein AUJ74_04170 [Candidatus Omnitrophica bacterium CG1_02_44_16]|nr:MAG: hypothetical protein AUJ74_04170 [Candidatus Omnitrophica bacterium CG1_02_44_16]PIY82852.1 MAG: hypothetical protein COY78_04635 [Candidatus Omnitrophica bacterium CG_4_10_14_0_8_um_filter_44_12]PIZ85135.1 MAG: hypothetical protein COX96_00110 [Candidatus Omnitrophica bacterium CG_4_10_14_0_2_um_filter_44_9]